MEDVSSTIVSQVPPVVFAETVQAELAQRLAPDLRPGSSFTILGVPNVDTVAASLAWLGTVCVARDLTGRSPSLVYGTPGADDEILGIRAIPGPILISGEPAITAEGARWRANVLDQAADRAVIQLPTSVSQDALAELETLGKAARRHGRFRFLVHDSDSALIAKDIMGIHAVIAPHVAFGLGPLSISRRPVASVGVFIEDLRLLPPHDVSAFSALQGQNERKSALSARHASRGLQLLRGSRLCNRAIDGASTRRTPKKTTLAAEASVARLAGQMLKYHVAITDSVHGHILAALVGLPHVALARTGTPVARLDNGRHRVAHAVFTDSAMDAINQAHVLLESVPRRDRSAA